MKIWKWIQAWQAQGFGTVQTKEEHGISSDEGHSPEGWGSRHLQFGLGVAEQHRKELCQTGCVAVQGAFCALHLTGLSPAYSALQVV